MDMIGLHKKHNVTFASTALQKSRELFNSAQDVCLQYPELAPAEKNLRFAIANVQDATEQIQSVAADGELLNHPQLNVKYPARSLQKSLEHLENRVLNLNSTDCMDAKSREELLRLVSSIGRESKTVIESLSLTDPMESQSKSELFKMCDDLAKNFEEFLNLVQETSKSEGLRQLLAHNNEWRGKMLTLMTDVVRRAFSQDEEIVYYLKSAALQGDPKEYDLAVGIFKSCVRSKLDAAKLACAMGFVPRRPLSKVLLSEVSTSIEEIEEPVLNVVEATQFIQMTAWQLEQVAEQVINAGQIVVAHAKSQAALDCQIPIAEMVALSIDAVKISVRKTSKYIDDDNLQEARIESDYIKSQIFRIVNFLEEQMDTKTQTRFQDSKLKLVDQYNKEIEELGWSASSQTLAKSFAISSKDLLKNLELLRSYCSILPTSDELVDEEVTEQVDGKTLQESGLKQSSLGSNETDDAGRKMRMQIANEIGIFNEERRRFIKEVTKWDDSANEIVSLAKQMCHIMQDMIEFTRGSGPLKVTMDVIQSARTISELGVQLDKLCRDVVEHCVDSASRRDLIAYLQRVTLYCHLLNITSRVKADVQNCSSANSQVTLAEVGPLYSKLDGASSLIQAAKNLMAAVVLTVKESYIASTKYRRESTVCNKNPDTSAHLQWRMKIPQKKPLVSHQPGDGSLIAQTGQLGRTESYQLKSHIQEFDAYTIEN
ncbi:hypothetical protein Ciccas_007890 [Cichlidogyrus casuarinus]|uniref:Uncharacterized protein n=1 Tax=Cichlidogyrus casuarinus TaxID=1844966 RepID=A0ABD2Q1J9_9PLAT